MPGPWLARANKILIRQCRAKIRGAVGAPEDRDRALPQATSVLATFKSLLHQWKPDHESRRPWRRRDAPDLYAGPSRREVPGASDPYL